jgi:ribonuclease R
LGFATYTHFTSPIRRYPDLIVHRLLKHYVVSAFTYPFPEIDDLTTAGNILSASEQRAVKCERQFMSIKKARFIEKFVGNEFTGMISSVARFGVFVLLREFDIDGLVKLENLGDDRWAFDEENLRIIGDRSKHVFKLGQLVKVTVTSVDVELGQINFDLNPEDKFSRKSGTAKSKEESAGQVTNKIQQGQNRARFNKDGKSRFKGSKDTNKDKEKSRFTKTDKPQTEKRRGSVKRIFDRKEDTQTTEVAEPKKKPVKKLFEVLERFKKKAKGGADSEDHRNRKDTGKDSKKRGKTKNNSRRFR